MDINGEKNWMSSLVSLENAPSADLVLARCAICAVVRL